MYYAVSFFVLSIFFGAIYLSGVASGVEWAAYLPHFSWGMFNSTELKQIIGVGVCFGYLFKMN
ncbi:hypothetical protein EQV77_06240 [Halobacillus fulvus]|nr:hypothetical protein EQV77_06240 [Halobacillus fulvus]